MQLRAQVSLVLEFGVDEVLDGSALVSKCDVVPAPNTSHLMVIVQPASKGADSKKWFTPSLSPKQTSQAPQLSL